MRVLTKFLLFVIFFTMPSLKLGLVTGGSGGFPALSEKKVQLRAVAMNGQIAVLKEARFNKLPLPLPVPNARVHT